MNEDLLQDLAQYKKYRDKNVMMASRSLIQHYRNTHPELLHRKDRVRTNAARCRRRYRPDGWDGIILVERETRTTRGGRSVVETHCVVERGGIPLDSGRTQGLGV